MNRKVLSLEAAGQLRVPETDYSHVVHPTEPLQFAASISRPGLLHRLSALWEGRSEQRSSAFGSALLSTALLRVTAMFSSRDTGPIAWDPHVWSQLEPLIQGRSPTGMQTVQKHNFCARWDLN